MEGLDQRRSLRRRLLFEKQIDVVCVGLDVFFEGLVLNEDIISAILRNERAAFGQQVGAYGNIISDFVVLSSNCLGPDHFFHVQLERQLNKQDSKQE